MTVISEKRQSRLLSLVDGVGRSSLRSLSLALLVVQNSALIIVMHWSRTSPAIPGQHRYFVSTAILLVEIIKLLTSVSLVIRDTWKAHPSARPAEFLELLYHTLCSRDAWKLVIPAGLYTLQNYLIYIAVSNMAAVTFQVTYQLKILTTVLFSILLLHKNIVLRQWMALVFLTIGIAMMQLPKSESGSESVTLPSAGGILDWFVLFYHNPAAISKEVLSHIAPSTISGSNPHVAPLMNTTKGLLAAVAASFTSGLTSVYFEKLIKDSLSSVSLWTRNAQLSFFSLFPAVAIGVIWQDGAAIAQYGFFVGYSPVVWATISLQALGGLLVALCITYADNVAKNFAASLSIVVSYVVSSMLFLEPMTLHSAAGICIVTLSTYLYQSSGSRHVTGPLLPVRNE